MICLGLWDVTVPSSRSLPPMLTANVLPSVFGAFRGGFISFPLLLLQGGVGNSCQGWIFSPSGVTHFYLPLYCAGIQSDSCLRKSGWNVKLYGLIKQDCKQTEFMTPRTLSSQMQSSLQLVNIIKKDFSSTQLFMELSEYKSPSQKWYATCLFMVYFEMIVNVLFGRKYTLWPRELWELAVRELPWEPFFSWCQSSSRTRRRNYREMLLHICMCCSVCIRLVASSVHGGSRSNHTHSYHATGNLSQYIYMFDISVCSAAHSVLFLSSTRSGGSTIWVSRVRLWLSRIEHNRIDLDWIELNWLDLNWIENVHITNDCPQPFFVYHLMLEIKLVLL